MRPLLPWCPVFVCDLWWHICQRQYST